MPAEIFFKLESLQLVLGNKTGFLAGEYFNFGGFLAGEKYSFGSYFDDLSLKIIEICAPFSV